MNDSTIGIKMELIKNKLGAYKVYKDDWKTIGFVIPRNLIQSQFIEKELQYNCIYFLIGFDGIKEKIYVGQAKKRNNGGSVLYRLREYDVSI